MALCLIHTSLTQTQLNMKKWTLLVLLLGSIATAQAQYETLILNYEKSCFGENEPLPVRKNFLVNGVVQSNIQYVEVSLYPTRGLDAAPVYENYWKRGLNSKNLNFTVPINFKLREGREYDIHIKYYRTTTKAERQKLAEDLSKTLQAYISQAFEVSTKELDLVNGSRRTLNDLNAIVFRGLSNYRTRTTAGHFQGFSDVVQLKLKQMDDLKLKQGAIDANDRQSRLAFKGKMMNELYLALATELEQVINADLYILADDVYIDDYPTEKVQNYLPVNIGYGGALLDANSSNFNYGAAPYLGLSIPFGKEGGSSPFWSKTSLSLGAFINNVTDQNGITYTGPIVKRPVYAAMGYRAYRFVRFNVGAVALENTNNNAVQIVPFVGLSAEFNLSVQLAK